MDRLELESVPYISCLKSLLVATTNIYNKSPFHKNPSLPEAFADGITKMWFTKGIKTFGDLFKDGSLQSFEEFSSQHWLPRTNFLKYLQVRHFVISEQGGGLQPLEQLSLDKLV